MKKFLTGMAALLLVVGVGNAFGQAPPPVVFSGNYTQPTYSAAVTGLTPAASATDWLTISGSASKVITVTEIRCTGVSTANASQLIRLVKRSTANSGGTSTAGTAIPHNAGNAAATATVAAYTANPTVGTVIGYVRNQQLTTGPAASSTLPTSALVWKFGTESPNQGIVLNGTAQTLSLNGNGASYSAGTAFSCSITWTEI